MPAEPSYSYTKKDALILPLLRLGGLNNRRDSLSWDEDALLGGLKPLPDLEDAVHDDSVDSLGGLRL